MSLAAPASSRAPAARTAANARDALVNALRGAGLDATGYAPDNPTAGAAWPQWNITNFDGRLCDPSRYTFDVYAVLNAGEAETTVAAGDALVGSVAPALSAVAVLQSAEPVLITFADQTTMPGVRFRVIAKA